MAFRLALLFVLTLTLASATSAQSLERRTTIAVLSFGDSGVGHQASESLAARFRSAGLRVLDSDLAMAAAQGAGYSPSLNMAVAEARTFGAVIGSDFYVLGDAQTLRRSPSSGQIYFESYASIFLVSARTGRLLRWQRAGLHAPKPAEAENLLLAALSGMSDALIVDLRRAQEEERTARAEAVERGVPIIETAPEDEETAAAEGMRLPRPFRRIQPPYPESAAAAEVEAVVDVLVDLDRNGEVTNAWITRWAGFGLDEATLETVRKLHFFPAMRNGTAIPLRVLLRYNFRKPPR